MEAALGPLLEDYSEAAVKKPVESIGVQVKHPSKLHFLFFFLSPIFPFPPSLPLSFLTVPLFFLLISFPKAQLWTDNIMDMSQKDLEFFFNVDQGVLGIDALPHKDPQVAY